MLTRCPYPDCGRTFEVTDDASWRAGRCAVCERPASLRPLDVLLKIEQFRGRLESRHSPRSVGPAGPSHRLTALLEDVRSLWNVGSIFRTADGAGFSLLYLCGITGCPPRKEILKTSLGAEQNVAWDYYTSALHILPHLKEQGVQVVGLELTPASIPLATAVEGKLLRKSLCLVVGNEVTGISAEVLPMCDLVCHLPMRGVKESLNVAVAFGIASYLVAEASLESGGVSKAGESC
ncbi:MAG TPA: TrmH family RNA methyltransferase [Candidatus Obscuribacterales bacterium]